MSIIVSDSIIVIIIEQLYAVIIGHPLLGAVIRHAAAECGKLRGCLLHNLIDHTCPAYELFIGLRYTRAKRRNHFISFISLISLLGITLGMTALITVMSVMNGFQKEVRSRILGVASHIQISGFGGPLTDWQQVAQEALRHPQVEAAAPYVSAQGMVSYNNVVSGVVVRGVLPDMEDHVADLGRMMIDGKLNDLVPGRFGIVIGRELARALGVFTGDKIVLISPQGQVTPAGILPRLKQFTITGIFEAGHFEYDSGLVLIHLADAQKLYHMRK